KLGEPGFVGIRPIAEQQNHMVGLDLAAALQADADYGSGVVERRDRALRHHTRHSRGLMWLQALDEERLRPRRLRAHDNGHAHAILAQHPPYLEAVVPPADPAD